MRLKTFLFVYQPTKSSQRINFEHAHSLPTRCILQPGQLVSVNIIDWVKRRGTLFELSERESKPYREKTSKPALWQALH
jgi:hypothetical protein